MIKTKWQIRKLIKNYQPLVSNGNEKFDKNDQPLVSNLNQKFDKKTKTNQPVE